MTSQENASVAANLLSEDHHDLDLLLSAVFDALDARDPQDVLARLDLFWARLAMHIRSEHLHLFTAIADAVEKSVSETEMSAGEKAEIDTALVRLRNDHDFFMRELANGVNDMREMVVVAPPNSEKKMTELMEKLAKLRDRLRTHNALEEKIVYRLPAKLLDQLRQSMLASSVRKELENLPPRFKNRLDDSGA